MENESTERDRKKSLKALGLFAIIVGDLVGFSAAGVGLGYFLWKKAGFPIWIILITAMSGLGLAFYRIYVFSEKIEKNE